jgi:hypothetical protein
MESLSKDNEDDRTGEPGPNKSGKAVLARLSARALALGLKTPTRVRSNTRFASGATGATAALMGTGLAFAANNVHAAQCRDSESEGGGWVEDAAVGGVVLTVMSGIGYLVYSAATSEGPPKSEEQKQQELEQQLQQQEVGKQQMKAAFVKAAFKAGKQRRRQYSDPAAAAKAYESELMKQLINMRITQTAQRGLMKQAFVQENLASGLPLDEDTAGELFNSEFEHIMDLMQQHAAGKKAQMRAAFSREKLASGEAKDADEAGRMFEAGPFAVLMAEAESEAKVELAGASAHGVIAPGVTTAVAHQHHQQQAANSGGAGDAALAVISKVASVAVGGSGAGKKALMKAPTAAKPSERLWPMANVHDADGEPGLHDGEPGRPSLSNLPDDLLLYVLELADRSDLAHCASLSRSWRPLVCITQARRMEVWFKPFDDDVQRVLATALQVQCHDDDRPARLFRSLGLHAAAAKRKVSDDGLSPYYAGLDPSALEFLVGIQHGFFPLDGLPTFVYHAPDASSIRYRFKPGRKPGRRTADDFAGLPVTGDNVRVRGLVNAAFFNGRCGVVIGVDAEAERPYTVQLANRDAPIRTRASNLMHCLSVGDRVKLLNCISSSSGVDGLVVQVNSDNSADSESPSFVLEVVDEVVDILSLSGDVALETNSTRCLRYVRMSNAVLETGLVQLQETAGSWVWSADCCNWSPCTTLTTQSGPFAGGALASQNQQIVEFLHRLPIRPLILGDPLLLLPAPSAAPSAEANTEGMLLASLASKGAEEQNQFLREALYPIVSKYSGTQLAGKITAMLLELDNSEIVNMLESSPETDIRSKVTEAMEVLGKAEALKDLGPWQQSPDFAALNEKLMNHALRTMPMPCIFHVHMLPPLGLTCSSCCVDGAGPGASHITFALQNGGLCADLNEWRAFVERWNSAVGGRLRSRHAEFHTWYRSLKFYEHDDHDNRKSLRLHDFKQYAMGFGNPADVVDTTRFSIPISWFRNLVEPMIEPEPEVDPDEVD